MTLANVVYVPRAGFPGYQVAAETIQIHDEVGAVGDTCNIVADGHLPIDGGTVRVIIGDDEIRQTYNVAGHGKRYNPPSTRIRSRKSVNHSILRNRAIAELLRAYGTGDPSTRRYRTPTAITQLANALGDVSASILHAGARAAVTDAANFNELARALETYGLFIDEEGRLVSIVNATGVATLVETVQDTLDIAVPNDDQSPSVLRDRAKLVGTYAAHRSRAELTGEYMRPGSDGSITIDVSGKFSNRLNFDRGMPVRWLRLLRESASITFTVDEGNTKYSVRDRLLVDASPDVEPDQLPWGRNASSREWWIVTTVDHRWSAVGEDGEPLDLPEGQGEWLTTVTAVPSIAGV